jgi:hypothetical protein
MPRNCPDCGSQLQDDGVIGWCPQEGCEFRGSVVMKTGKIIRGTDWECPHCKRLNYGAECKECGAEFAEIHS